LESLKNKYKSKKDEFAALQQELQETVPLDEFNRVNAHVAKLTKQLDSAKEEV